MKKRIKKLLTSISFVIIGSMCLTGCDWDDGIGVGDEIELEDRIDLSDRVENQIEGQTENQDDNTTEDMLNANTEVGIENDMQNVEQRDYATILLVSDGSGDEDYEFSLAIAEEKKVGEKSQTEKVVNFKVDDLEDLYEEYWSVKGKSLSLVHLKVIIMEKKDGQTFGEVLTAQTVPVSRLVSYGQHLFGPYHFYPLLCPSWHEMFPWYL